MLNLSVVSMVLTAGEILAYRYLVRRDRITPVLARFFRSVAARKTAVCLASGLLVLLVRLALLPVWPIPLPSIYDEFSYLLQADTFAHGRLTNPAHPMWRFFESIYILQQPTYASKYPPGQAVVMAAGQVLFGHPWFGVWLSCGALAAVLCWALQGWLPSRWALLGSLIGLNLCLYTYWMNSYWGGAASAIGGAMVIVAWPRIVRANRAAYAWLFGTGAAILLLTRPYEGFLLLAPAAVALWLRSKRARVWVPISAVVLAGLSFQALYDYRITGHALRMPYQEYFSQYESIPPLIVLPVQPAKVYRHFDLEFLNSGWTRDTNADARSWRLPGIRAADFARIASTVFGHPLWLVVLLAFAPLWIASRRMRLPVVWAGCLMAGATIELIFYAHYAAPFTAVLLILLVQSLRAARIVATRHLGKQGGRFVVLALACSFIGPAAALEAIHVYRHLTPDQMKAANWRKGELEDGLIKHFPGWHVIFVRYTGTQKPHEEWIYNLADIDGQPVVWAQDMGSENSALMQYYPGRSFWMFEPDRNAEHLEPLSSPAAH
jgi:hypothetical protein